MPRTKEAFEAMRENTKQKIEATALCLFARKGLSVTVDEIARAAGLSKGLLYNHYPSKDALIAELVRQTVATSGISIMGFAKNDGSAAEKIRQISDMMCRMFAESHLGIDCFMFMVQVGMSGFKVPDASLYSENSPNPLVSLAEIVVQGQAEGTVVHGDPLGLSVIYWAAIQGLCCYAVAGVPISPDPGMLNRILLKESLL